MSFTSDPTFIEKNLQRVFFLVPLIYNHQGLSLQQLQKLAGFATEKELRRGLDRLMMFGIPPFSPSDFITVHIDDKQQVWLDFPLNLERPLALSTAEWIAIQKLLRAELEFISQGSAASEQLRELLDKLSGVPVAYEADDQVLLRRSIIQEALEDNLQLEFHYRSLSSREAELRRVEPWALFKNYGNSYLIAYCCTRGAPRCFLLERMQNLALLELEQEHLPPSNLETYLKALPMFQADPPGFTVKLAFAADILANLRYLFRLEDVQPWQGQPASSVWLEARCKVQDSIWLRATLRGLGTEIILLEPEHLRESYLKELNEIAVPLSFE